MTLIAKKEMSVQTIMMWHEISICRQKTKHWKKNYQKTCRLTSERSVGLVQKPGSNDQIWLISALYVLYSTIRLFFSYSSPVHVYMKFTNSLTHTLRYADILL